MLNPLTGKLTHRMEIKDIPLRAKKMGDKNHADNK
jgi:hypothetical protein